LKEKELFKVKALKANLAVEKHQQCWYGLTSIPEEVEMEKLLLKKKEPEMKSLHAERVQIGAFH
jgi:hypothetical protein